MHDHEFFLIAQLAEGSLPGEQRAQAEKALATCGECRAEYEAQVFALEALSDVEPARLTEFERAQLHRGVSEATRVPAAPARRPLAAWVPKLAVAAVAVAFVGVVGIGLSQRAGQDAASEAAADSNTVAESTESDLAFSDTTAAASESMAAAAPEAAVESLDEQAAAEEAAAGAASRLSGLLQPLNLGQIDDNALSDLSLQRSAPGDVPERSGIQQPLEPFPFACVGTAVGTLGGEDELTVAGVGVLDGRLVEVLGFGNEIFAFDRTNCEVVTSQFSP